jgi:hypothetical protein
MSCENVHELISPLLDRRVTPEEREKVLAHLESCRKCGAYVESLQNLQSALRRMSHAPVPANLTARLRVMASHERSRQMARESLGSRWRSFAATTQLWFDNLMRPMALPFAGGLLSALVLFGLLVPTLSFQHNFADQALFTYPDGEVIVLGSGGGYLPVASYGDVLRIEHGAAAIPADANVVWLTIDETGKVSNWAVERGKLTPDLLNIIMFSQFTPATVLGLPTSAKVRVVQGPPDRTFMQTRTRSMRS